MSQGAAKRIAGDIRKVADAAEFDNQVYNAVMDEESIASRQPTGNDILEARSVHVCRADDTGSDLLEDCVGLANPSRLAQEYHLRAAEP